LSQVHDEDDDEGVTCLLDLEDSTCGCPSCWRHVTSPENLSAGRAIFHPGRKWQLLAAGAGFHLRFPLRQKPLSESDAEVFFPFPGSVDEVTPPAPANVGRYRRCPAGATGQPSSTSLLRIGSRLPKVVIQLDSFRHQPRLQREAGVTT